MAADPALAPAVVVVVGGDAVVGQALELLLRGANHRVRFVDLPSFSAPESLKEAKLLLLAPGLGPVQREAVLASIGTEPEVSNFPVVELIPTGQALRVGERHFVVPWPCRTADLERQIETALIVGSDRERAGQGHG